MSDAENATETVLAPAPDELVDLRPGQVARFVLTGDSFLLTAFDPSGKAAWGALCASPARQAELIDRLGGSVGPARARGLELKLVGKPATTARARAALVKSGFGQGIREIDGSAITLLYFYGGTGRLRARADREAPAEERAGKRTRVLIVDDSLTIRKLLTRILSEDPELEVVGAAERPSQVEEMIRKLKPDVVTLDVHMPEMDGVTLLRSLIPRYPLPYVMISSLSLEDGGLILDALEAGAVDSIQKPAPSELGHMIPVIREKLKSASRVRIAPRPGHARIQCVSSGALDPSRLVAIGSSTGGTEALRVVLTGLPAEIPPIVIVQHIPPVFSKALANRLNDLCPFEVREAQDGDETRPNLVLIAPGGKQMKLVRSGSQLRARITDDAPVNRHKPSVDYLFDSVATEVGRKAVGVILTGMGNDGAKGLLKMRQAGSSTIAQDEATSVVFGMPKEAIAMGGAESIKPIDRIAEQLSLWLARKKAA